MLTPLISVIIPTYNRAHTLRRALDSVLAQRQVDLEIIVVDDGSTDGSSELIQQAYPTVKLIQQDNFGVSHARNRAIEQAKGEWIALLDSDDSWHHDKLMLQLQALTDNPDMKVCHTEEIWYRNGKRVNAMKKHAKKGGWIFKECLALCCMSPSSIVIHQDIFEQLGYFDEDLPVCEDYDLWLRITAQHPVLFLEQALTIKVGGHDDQLSHQYWGMDRFRIDSIVKLLRSEVLSEEQQEAAKQSLREKIEIYCQGARKRGRLDEVLQYEQMLELS